MKSLANFLAFAIATAILFLAGWALACFIVWEWTTPLTTTGSRVWLVMCMIILAATAEKNQNARASRKR